MDILDILLDKDNRQPISLTDGNGKNIIFEQVAVIPLRGNLYCVLKPITQIEGISDDEAVVFRADEKCGEIVLVVEEDELVAIDVFEKYYDLLEEQMKKK